MSSTAEPWKGSERAKAWNREWQRQWRIDNPEKAREKDRKAKFANPAAYLIRTARCRAKRQGLAFEIEAADLLPLPTVCPALGIEIVYGLTKLSDNSPSVDRIENSIGYVKGNVIVVSQKANRMKSNGTVEELGKLFHFYSSLVSGE